MRVDKFLSNCNIMTRKECQQACKKGRIVVDGVVITDCATHIDEKQAIVLLDNERIHYNEFVYIMLNKPAGVVSSTEDGDRTVIDLLPPSMQKWGLFPCGRLDKNTVGLIILTNNGQLSHKLLSPRHHVSKTYYFECANALTYQDINKLQQGILLKEGLTRTCKINYETEGFSVFGDETLDVISYLKSNYANGKHFGTITLTEGKYHQIKRMFKSINNEITYLKRITFASILLDNTLKEGESRYLTDNEIQILFSHK